MQKVKLNNMMKSLGFLLLSLTVSSVHITVSKAQTMNSLATTKTRNGFQKMEAANSSSIQKRYPLNPWTLVYEGAITKNEKYCGNHPNIIVIHQRLRVWIKDRRLFCDDQPGNEG